MCSYDGHLLGLCTVSVWVDVSENVLPSSSLLLNLLQVGAGVIVGNEFVVCVGSMEGNFADQR